MVLMAYIESGIHCCHSDDHFHDWGHLSKDTEIYEDVVVLDLSLLVIDV